LLRANWDYIGRFGIMALRDGAAVQLLELFINGAISIFAYLLFKVTESVLVEWIKTRGKKQNLNA
jgi:hypothetical protein